MGSHAIKFVGQNLNLVTSLDIEPCSQITFANEFHSSPQRFKRTNHSSANEKSGQQSNTEANEEQNGSAQQRRINRLICFFYRSFNEHSPVKARNESVRAENCLFLHVPRRHCCWPEYTRAGLKGCFHLVEFAHVLSQTTSGMRNEFAGPLNDIAITGLSQFNRRNQI